LSWKKYCPDYKFILWNEENFDIDSTLFTKQIAEIKKWGFIVDYIRAWAVYNYGGIYLDTDVELLKPLDDLLVNNICFSGFENEKNINPGSIFSGEKACVIAKEILDFYSVYNFIKENGELNLTDSPQIFTKILLKYSLKQNNTYQELGVFTAYPTEYFSPKSFRTGEINVTANTYSIHQYSASWLSEIDKIYLEKRYKIYSSFGDNIFTRLIIRIVYFIKRIKISGIRKTLLYYVKKIFYYTK
jgi:mannosyltransferase OCH1-like enzyme